MKAVLVEYMLNLFTMPFNLFGSLGVITNCLLIYIYIYSYLYYTCGSDFEIKLIFKMNIYNILNKR